MSNQDRTILRECVLLYPVPKRPGFFKPYPLRLGPSITLYTLYVASPTKPQLCPDNIIPNGYRFGFSINENSVCVGLGTGILTQPVGASH